MTEYVCDDCGKEYKSRSGLYKHKQRVHPEPEISDEEIEDDIEYMEGEFSPTQDEDEFSSPPSTYSDSDDWMDFTFDSDSDDSATVRLPSVLKAVAKREKKSVKKMTKAELKIQSKTNIAILKMGLTGIDSLITKYGKAVYRPEYECLHSDSDKELVANAQWEYLKESGLDLSTYLSTGGVALALTGWFVVPPVYEIQKNKQKTIFGKAGRVGGSIMARIPLIGRFFKKREKPIDDPSTPPSEGDL